MRNMLGRSHVISGATTATLILCTTHLLTRDIPTAIAAATIITGGAIMPDLDHPGATVARSLRPVGPLISKGVSALAGGHRNGTHGLIGALIFGALTILISLWNVNVDDLSVYGNIIHVGDVHAGLGLVCGFCCGIALTALHLDPFGAPSWLVAILVAVVTSLGDVNPILAGIFMLIGCIVHTVLGDALTIEKVPFLYPLSKKRFGLPLLGHTGSSRESIYVLCLIGIMILTLCVKFFPWA